VRIKPGRKAPRRDLGQRLHAWFLRAGPQVDLNLHGERTSIA